MSQKPVLLKPIPSFIDAAPLEGLYIAKPLLSTSRACIRLHVDGRISHEFYGHPHKAKLFREWVTSTSVIRDLMHITPLTDNGDVYIYGQWIESPKYEKGLGLFWLDYLCIDNYREQPKAWIYNKLLEIIADPCRTFTISPIVNSFYFFDSDTTGMLESLNDAIEYIHNIESPSLPKIIGLILYPEIEKPVTDLHSLIFSIKTDP